MQTEFSHCLQLRAIVEEVEGLVGITAGLVGFMRPLNAHSAHPEPGIQYRVVLYLLSQ